MPVPAAPKAPLAPPSSPWPVRAQSAASDAPFSAPLWSEPSALEAVPLELAPEPELSFERPEPAAAPAALHPAPALELAREPAVELPVEVPVLERPAPVAASAPRSHFEAPRSPVAPAVEAVAVQAELELRETDDPLVEVVLEEGEQLLGFPEAEPALSAADPSASDEDELDLSGILDIDPQEPSAQVELSAAPTTPALATSGEADSGEELDALFAQIQRDE
jgi:hypothetical protein